MMIAPPAVAQETRTMNVLGAIDGSADGTERRWLTISGDIEGETMSSAAWRSYSAVNVLEGALAGMDELQAAQMRERMEQMAEITGNDGAANPLAQMLGGNGEEQVVVRIMGVDPDAERILRQGFLTIELPPFAVEDTDRMLNEPTEADVSFHKNFGTETGLYLSSHDVGTDATVAFDRLEIVEGGGFASGTFEGSLCPLRSLMGAEIDPETCIMVAGSFETDLGQDAEDDAGPQAGN